VLCAQGQEPPTANDPAGQEPSRQETSRLETAAATRVSTVQEVLASQKDDEDVVLRGQIVRHVKGEDYMFSDGTGEIEIEIDDDDYSKDRIQMNTEVEIRGEVDLDRNERPTIEVDEIATAPGRMR
jgi:uncharacterized protein (TIGR00156 family)